MTEVHGGTAIVEVLRAFGVTEFFSVPGESFLPVLDALRAEPSIRLITNRHESGASFAADGFAKISGRPAVCMATRGPGASNLSIGIQTARYDSTPLVALLGLTPSELQGSQSFQEFDPLSMFSSLAKRSLVVASRASLEATIAQALAEATTGRPGSVVVGIPSDFLSAEAPAAPFGFLKTQAEAGLDVDRLVERIRKASVPAFIMSTGAVRGTCAADVGAAAAQLGAPVFCGWRRFSAFDNAHPCFAGSLGLGMPPSVISTLERADLVVAFGSLEQVTIDSGRLNRRGLVIVNVAPAPDANLARQLGLAHVIQISCKPELVARLLAEEVGLATHSRSTFEHLYMWQHPASDDFTADTAVSRLNQSAAADAIIVSDAGDFAQALLRTFSFDRKRSFIGPVNGAMGYGLPGAIGAKLAEPARPVFCIAGDGGLLMTVGEMETAIRLGIDLTVVVFNDHAYGTIKTRQAEAFPGKEYGTSLGDVCFSKIAMAMGWKAWAAQTPSEFDAALRSAESSSGCRLVEVRL